MTPAQAEALVAYIQAAYPRFEFPPSSVAVYADQLVDLDFDIARRAVAEVISEQKFLPAISEIRAAYYEHEAGWPIPEEAWPLAIRYVVHGAEVSPLIQDAVYAMGSETIRRSYVDDPRPRDQFIRIYRAIRERRMRELAAGDESRLALGGVPEHLRELAGSVAKEIP